MKAPFWIAPVMSIAVMAGAYGIGNATGVWSTSGPQVVAGQRITVDDLRGSMSIQQAADGLGMSAADIIALLNAPAGLEIKPTTLFKELESLIDGFELSTFREVLRAHLAGTAAPSATPAATSASVPQQGSTGAPATPTDAATSHAPTATSTSTQAISGRMTLREVATSNGVDLAELIKKAGLPADVNPDQTLTELRTAIPGFEIQTIRDAVAALK